MQEIQIAIGRIRALASDLEDLGQTDSVREVIALEDCIARALPSVPGVTPSLEWCCAQDIKVRVDSAHAQRAIVALIRVAMATDSSQYPGAVTVTRQASGERNCTVCDASLKRKDSWVFLRTSGVHRLNPDVLRDPFRSDKGGRTSRRLAVAVLDRCAHRAGGHLSLDRNFDFLSLALPMPG
jgi:hypothetical protein